MSEFFLKRYRALRPDVTLIDPSTIKQALRVNTTKVTHERLLASLQRNRILHTRIPWLRNGYHASAEFSLGSTKEYLLGWYYLQGPLSQLACEVLEPRGMVLDMAAAPGGKTTYLAQLAPESTVVALDTNPSRLAAVRNNVERLGLVNVVCVRKDARFATDLKQRFDTILLDAPCSGNYCSEEGWFERRTVGDVAKNARTQRELLKAAVRCLAPGGRLLYSTCSLEPEEDECAVHAILQKHPELDVVPIDVPVGDPGATSWEGQDLDPRLATTRRFWPDRTGCEGFYMALLERKA